MPEQSWKIETQTYLLKPIPADYALTLLAALTSITHFCILDTSGSTAIVPTVQVRIIYLLLFTVIIT